MKTNYKLITSKTDKVFTDYKSVFTIIGKSFFKNPRGIFFTILVPTFFMIIFYYLFGSIGGNNTTDTTILGYIMLPALTILTSLSGAIIEWKNSVFLKRIDTTGIGKSTFLMSLWSFHLLVGIFGIAFEMVISLAIAQDTAIHLYQSLNWGYFILGSLLVLLMSIAIASLIGGLMSNDGAAQAVTMIVYFISMFLSGIMLDPSLFGGIKGLRILSYFIPHMYPTFILLFAGSGSVGWDATFNVGFNDSYHVFTQTWQPIIGSIGLILSLFVITSFTFKWSAKK